MKKASRAARSNKRHTKKPVDAIAPLETPLVSDELEGDELVEDQFAVTGREEEASSSGHKVEAIEPNDEDIGEKLVEEGLQGHMHLPKKPR
jgi:hypothetical protein